MNVKHVQILADAENDLDEGRTFYGKQGENVGNYFWDSLLSDIESLIIFAGVHSKKLGYYRMLAKRFPYAIYYDVNGDTDYVVAILPMRRDPTWITKKIGKNYDMQGAFHAPNYDQACAGFIDLLDAINVDESWQLGKGAQNAPYFTAGSAFKYHSDNHSCNAYARA